MKYFFELGNHPALSVAEIAAICGANTQYQLISEKILIADLPHEFDAKKAIKEMGGIIKIGRLFALKIKHPDIKACLPALEEIIKSQEEKICFGISYYGRKKANLKYLGMDIKSMIKERGLNCRWVSGKENVLSSVIVEQNRLLSKGFELVLIEDNNDLLVGRSLAVQPFKELSWRDYGRPARDDQSGMLPPKLAQIMLNLASAAASDKAKAKLLDPFCGSGTIISEALLLGFKNIIGSDNSTRAVLDTQKNIDWLLKHADGEGRDLKSKIEIKQIDARGLSKEMGAQTIDVIATEPFLGPQRGALDISAIKKELEALYSEVLGQFKIILKPHGRIVMLFPVFCLKQKKHFLNPDLSGYKIINPLPRALQENKNLKISFRKTLLYGRASQRVWREVVVLELIN